MRLCFAVVTLCHGLCLFIQESRALPVIVLPVQQLLIVYELGALSVGQFFPEMFVLEQLQHVQTLWVSAKKTRKNVSP